MIHKMNKFIFLAINCIFLATACEDDDALTILDDVSIVAQNDCMVGSISDLNAILCITDTKGNSKTSFEKNENFIISLSFQNNSGELVKIKEEYLANEGVLTVMGADNGQNFGKPYTSAGCQFDGNPFMEVPSGETYVVSSPWVLEEGVPIIGPICKSESNEYLDTGSYRVLVSLELVVEMGNETISVEGGNELSLDFDIM